MRKSESAAHLQQLNQHSGYGWNNVHAHYFFLRFLFSRTASRTLRAAQPAFKISQVASSHSMPIMPIRTPHQRNTAAEILREHDPVEFNSLRRLLKDKLVRLGEFDRLITHPRN